MLLNQLIFIDRSPEEIFTQGPAYPSDSPRTGILVGVGTCREDHDWMPVIVKHLETQLELIRKKSILKIFRKMGKKELNICASRHFSEFPS